MVLYSCSITKHIPEGERLYTGATIEIAADSIIKNEKELKTELETILRPEPNSKFLGMYVGLYYYYKNQKENPGFLNRWLYKQLGEKPVYQSSVEPFEVEAVLRNRLENKGFFYSTATSSFEEKEIEASINYKLNVTEPYKMKRFEIDSMPSPLYEAVKKETDKSPFQNDMRFDLSNMKLERQRIDTELKQQGYYNLNSDFFIFEADTTQYDKKRFDLFLKLKAEVPKKATIPYQISSINVFSNYDLQDSTHVAPERFNNKNYIQDTLFMKLKYLDEFVTLKEGDLYSPDESKNTARRLSKIGAYKYVNIQYKEIDSLETDSLGLLEANIFLSPLTKRAVRAELQGVTKSNNYTGPHLALTYSNRNVFNGGETLNISTNVGYESQFSSGDDAGNTSLELGLTTELIFPRVLFPVKINTDFFKYSIPKTITSVGLNYLSRSDLYTLLSANGQFGYSWNANRFITYAFNPIAVSYTRLSNTTAEFDAILEENSYLEQSFDQQFISGMTFSFTYNEMVDANDPNQFYLNTTLDVAGNSISLLGQETTSGEPKEFLGLEYAQYAKADLDLRFHLNFGKDRAQTLATRLFAGYGLPYGNSDVIPYVKQYFSGGPYSVRAFKTRSLGPGTYDDESDDDSDVTYFDQTGNIRLEANVEYRFPLFSFFKGAVFADAGNVWNSKTNSVFDGEDKFTSNFINELGMGAGFGLHIDVQGFVIRFDLAAPFHDPSLAKGERWDFKYDEPVLNFAIGYSF
ncbi:BamA/TamA family outer membrane protein [Winogradskyella psychrotolerans]|uniref:translocation and assembly module lipoprotein TamL n=1 Tax=Winogradskyella psychrotolerans TaxID=1344585 RepID=UPI001C06E52B|nr:BamA/TamA family outer membrane protein [Winogradskyella psychrotolerans]MBU2927701.1 BamA/TamA family outer membrane protein [Winogradskyella psychrotolerans]